MILNHFIQLIRAEKNGIEVPKSKFDLQKNSLLHKWSQVSNILSVISSHEPSTSDRLRKLICECNEISELADSPPIFQFLQEQLQLMLYSAHGRPYSKHVLILAAELICIFPAAYRFLRNSNTLLLPNEKLVRELMNKSYQDNNLRTLLERLEPQHEEDRKRPIRLTKLTDMDAEVLSTEFLDKLDRGGLSMPTLASVNFVHCAMCMHNALPEPRKNCGKYFRRLLSLIDCPIAKITKAGLTLSNTLFKGFVLNSSDSESSLGCLKRKGKLSTEKQ